MTRPLGVDAAGSGAGGVGPHGADRSRLDRSEPGSDRPNASASPVAAPWDSEASGSGRRGGLAIAIESSTRRASVAVSFAGQVRAAELSSDRPHASDLLPTIDRLVREVGAMPRDLSGVVVGTGPGSYTGLRVGLATAMGLARAAGARILGVPSGEALCAAVCRPGQVMSLLLDARSGEIYFARYRRERDEVSVLEAPCVLTPDAARARIGGDEPIYGDASVADAVGLDAAARARLVVDRPPDAEALLALGRTRLERGIESHLATLEPLYLRPFAATERRR